VKQNSAAATRTTPYNDFLVKPAHATIWLMMIELIFILASLVAVTCDSLNRQDKPSAACGFTERRPAAHTILFER
jgi:hypothetical protein